MKSIGEHAFENTNISTITIPEGVTSIGYRCFYECSSLSSVQLPSSLVSIGQLAFSKTKIIEVTILPKVEYKKDSFPKNCRINRIGSTSKNCVIN